ncbi:MAG: roadblock/LC7 domain-containing protein [Candidatus Thermoplasmatota archaeon]|nr:roadblock/LC7 domain-containing protein [Candidatus Thermoplasmatota archaeon]
MEQELDQLLSGKEGILGMALVSRDGIPVLSRFTRQFDQKAFSILVESAMVATLAGAAEEAMEELEGGSVKRVIVEAGEVRLVVAPASADLLLLAVTEPAYPMDQLDETMGQAREGIVAAI